MKQPEYGKLVSSKEAMTLQDDLLPGARTAAEDRDITQLGNALWSYKAEHKINGIHVADSDCDLMIDRDDLLFSAFQLVQIPRSVIFWMSPDDEESVKLYDKQLKDVYDGRILIQEETKQYDTTKCKFMVWIRYDEVSYVLHPRFEYLREEM